MDKRIIFAVAGSGKTSHIIDRLCLNKDHLIVTYTRSNINNLRSRIIQKFGLFPKNIKLLPYFQFLYSFCFRPILGYKLRSKGLHYNQPPEYTSRVKWDCDSHYFASSRRIFHNRLGKLLVRQGLEELICKRLEKYYDCFYVDEIQDFAGNDFNLLKGIVKANLDILLVGDYFQHTYDTSRDGHINGSLHKDLNKYIAEFESMGLAVDFKTLDKSYRCTPTICEFITNNLGIKISSHRKDESLIEFVQDQETIDELIKDENIVKLFFRNSSKYSCRSKNWGKCKGEDCYVDVCVILNPTSFKLYEKGELIKSAPTTKNKLYVACSRTKGNLYFIEEKNVKKYKL